MAIRLSSVVVVSGSLFAVAWPQGTKLNSELARLPAGDVELLDVAPDGSFAIYQADPTTDEEFELFSVPSDGSDDPILLAALGYGGTCQISPDGSLAVFHADHDKDGSADLFSVPTDGSAAALRLNPLLAANHSVRTSFEVTADGSRVVYLEGLGTIGGEKLYSVPIDGSASAVELNPPLGPSEHVRSFELDPAGARAVFHLVQSGGIEQLFVVPVDDSAAPVQLNGTLVTGGDVLDYVVGTERVVYRADQDVDGVNEIFGVPLDASQAAIQLNGILPAAGDVLAFSDDDDPELVASGKGVLYIADARVDQVNELFFAASDGSTPAARISGTLVTGGDVASFAVSADGAWAVYLADQTVNNKPELFSVPLDFKGHARRAPRQPARRLNGLPQSVIEFAISPESDRVLYLANPTVAGRELYSVPIDGSAPPQKISGTLVAGGDVLWPASISPDGERVVYAADQQVNGRVELYSVPIDDSLPPVKLNGTPVLHGGSSAPQFEIGPDGARVFYVMDQLTEDVRELFGAPLDASAAAIRLSDPMTALGPVDGRVSDVEVSPDGLYAVYFADQEVVGRTELYSVGIAPLSAPVRVNGDLVQDGDVDSVAISADSQWLLYSADQEVDGRVEIYAAPIDGSASPVKLNHAPLPPCCSAVVPMISPLSDLVLFGASETPSHYELFSVPIDGSAAPIKLNGPLPPGANVGQFKTEGVRVVYGADQDTNNVSELYSVPIDGSAAPIKLNPTPVAGGDVVSYFEISSLGQVVYRADQDTDEVYELYSVPIDGSASAVKLNDVPVAGGDVAGGSGNPLFAIDPTGAFVVYGGDQDTDNVDEIYSVPIDGSAAPTKLNAPFPPMAADVRAFQISPDGARVVYLSNQDGNTLWDYSSVPIDGSAAPVVLTGSELLPVSIFQFPFQFGSGGARVVYIAEFAGVAELYSVPTDGSAAAVKVNDPPVAGGRVLSRPEAFRVTADGERVVYISDELTDGVHELFDAAIDGSGAPVKLNSTLPAGGDVHTSSIDFFGPITNFQLANGRAFYIADQETDEIYELFMSALVVP